MAHEGEEYYFLEVYPSKKKGYWRWHVLKHCKDGSYEAEFGGFDYFDSADDAEANAAKWLENSFDFTYLS